MQVGLLPMVDPQYPGVLQAPQKPGSRTEAASRARSIHGEWGQLPGVGGAIILRERFESRRNLA